MINWIQYDSDRDYSRYHSRVTPFGRLPDIHVISLDNSPDSDSALCALLCAEQASTLTDQISMSVSTASGPVLVTSSDLWSRDPKWPESDNAVPAMLELLKLSERSDAAPAEGTPRLPVRTTTDAHNDATWCRLGAQIMDCVSTSTPDELQAIWNDLKTAREDRVKRVLAAAKAVCATASIRVDLESKMRMLRVFSVISYFTGLSSETAKFLKVISNKWTDGSPAVWDSIAFSTIDLVEIRNIRVNLCETVVQKYCNEMQPWPDQGTPALKCSLGRLQGKDL